MGRKKRAKIEFRFYEVPQGERCLALLGEKWIMVYGKSDKYLHFHNLFEVGYCRNGEGHLILGEKTCNYESGMFSAIPANYPHTTISYQENFWEYIFFDMEEVLSQIYPGNPSRVRQTLDIVNKRADLFYEDEQAEMAQIIKSIMEEMRDKKPYYNETTANLLRAFVLLLIRIQEHRTADSRFVRGEDRAALKSINPAIEFVDRNYSENVKIAELALSCSMSETHFRRVFEDVINMSPIDYLNLVRIQNACRIMNTTEHSMEVVASECGFTNFSTFNRNFRKFLNTSPYQWKKNRENYESKLLNYNISAIRGW
ncbi:MAG: helix-turn-helix transcriptional regulator [Butyrivibrio sp.]|nr:helix-turn-helix transcriptional regulator [Butyrivibrio sp.]